MTDLYHITDNLMWNILGEELERVFNELRPRLDEQFWDQERQHFMHHPWFPRSLMIMHLQQYTDYRIQHGLNNALLA
ncbi:hypothetical protein [Arsenophonus endosymbiont of Aphis craccivora]|uniref:hypothetical protein n=1 Tax=Arsenophonus endosymbiont of Aphis craccivora TaxID=1231049 RepID=UPI0034E2D2A2